MNQKSSSNNLIKDTIRFFFTGFLMGSADLVPGVSGGTVAFLLGIYEELIYGIKVTSGQALRLLIKGKIKEAIALVPFRFFIPLGLGLASAVITLSGLITHFLVTYPSLMWAFIFGLSVASIIVVSKRVVTWDLHDYVATAVTAVIAYFVVGMVPVSTPDTWLAFFLSGVIAICAMILPGISGSFILVILGKYEQVLGAISDRNFLVIFIFGLGALVGIAVFSRVLSWLFKKHHDIIVALLTGIMIGSLRKVWPWKETISTRLNSHGELVPLVEQNVIPEAFTNDVLFSLLLFGLGVITVLGLEKLQATKEVTTDIDNPAFTKEHAKALKSQESHQV